MSDRQELINNAVAFLSDPKSQASSLAQRIQFLEAKGLTPAEIDLAIRQASPQPVGPAPLYRAPYNPYAQPPNTWDWRDYFVCLILEFITAIVSGSVVYGAVSLFKKYVSPHLQPPDATAYEEDRDALTAQFDKAEALLREIQAETAAVKAAVEEQKDKVDKTTKDVEAVVSEMRQGEVKTRDEMREIRDEINTIRDMLPKMIEKNKETQTQSLAELQQELKSLKALLLSRGPTTSNLTASTPPIGRPSIPAWQLASSPSTPVPTSNSPVVSPSDERLPPAASISSVVDPLTNVAHVQEPKSEHDKSPTTEVENNEKETIEPVGESANVSTLETDNSEVEESPKESFDDANRGVETKGEEETEVEPAVPVEAGVDQLENVEPLRSPTVETEPTKTKDEDASAPLPQNDANMENLTPEVKDDTALVDSNAKPMSPANGLDAPQDNSSSAITSGANVEELQERLKLVEQRFTDVSKSFKRLQAEKLAADSVLRELTPVETLQDSDGLRSYLQNIAAKVEISQEEIKRLNGKLEGQEDRLEELRDTHRLESRSQSEQIESLRKQLRETEALLTASQGSITQGEDNLAKRQAEVSRLNEEVAKAKELAKEEEEKRVKAISLLKTVRQKLVKAEKDKEDAAKELSAMKEKENSQREKEEAEKTRLQKEIDSANAEREVAVNGLKAQFDKELATTRDQHEKETAAIRSQYELEAVTAKSVHTKAINAKTSRISQLETSLEVLTRDKNSYFDQLQLRQAEYESSQEQVELLRNQNAEMQHQIREYADQFALLKEELHEAQREQGRPVVSPSSEDTARLMSAVEARYEAKLADLKRVLQNVEKERGESDTEWARVLREKKREVEELKQMLGSATRSKEQDEDVVGDLKTQISSLQAAIQSKESQISRVSAELAQVKDVENSHESREAELAAKIEMLEKSIEEGKSRESQLRLNVKTLREEMRKVQSSAALLDRQRNRGVGYWTSRPDSAPPEPSTNVSSPSGRSSTSDAPPSKDAEEEVNLEYLRNVILQFLEHKEMRPNLVKVLSVILHFTPQETRRLIAKV
ncbi:hypothetical protein K435DRAFT_648447 [Dendrothele bispora CBS 962.96]|uniref:Peroxisomal membrane protein PEX14 n=1 Tax=Dendrothele bispora (strain CBS 962.96) TaxID=1314807 RepID=A0A4S8MPF8_DENBC|nr:hypothetical protein K435DRAFT_648447 [Dendrothele bispora CBS 962.96]